MDNVMRVVESGRCTGCSACGVCEHISFAENQFGFYSPVVDDECNGCGECLAECIYDPYKKEDED